MKITPAMKRWAKMLAGGKCKVTRTGISYARAHGSSHCGGFTSVMGSKMEDAGLITWEPPSRLHPGTLFWDVPSVQTPQTAVLTAAGKECAA